MTSYSYRSARTHIQNVEYYKKARTSHLFSLSAMMNPQKEFFLSLSPLLFFLTPPFDCLPCPLLIMIENQTLSLTLFERDLRVTCIDLTVQVSSDAKIDDDLGFD